MRRLKLTIHPRSKILGFLLVLCDNTFMREIYLDNAASTPIDPRVMKVLHDASIRFFGNPSNIKHQHGRLAKDAMEKARKKIGKYLGLDYRGIIFTSGATEANNLALRGIACLQQKKCSAIISSVEHSCVDESAKFLLKRGVNVKAIPTLSNGQINLKVLSDMIKSSQDLKFISVITANNETGVIQQIEEVIRFARWKGAYVHTDAVQAIGKISLAVVKHADMISISGHKIHGPKGIGLLWVKPGLKISPLLVGGGQESGIRSGTSPVPLIVAFAKAIEIAVKDKAWIYTIDGPMRNLEKQILTQIPGTILNGAASPRIPNISNISFPSRGLLIDKLQGLAVSSGAACSCLKPQPSKVLLSMGLTNSLAKNSIRISAGRFTTPEDIARAAHLLIAAAKNI